MFCPNCGAKNPDTSKFCVSCGSSLKIEEPKPAAPGKIQLRCNACGGTLEAPNDRNVLVCPYCGAKELMTENDNVAIQRLKSNTTKDLVFGVMDRAQEARVRKMEEQRRKEEENRRQLKVLLPVMAGLAILLIVFALIMSQCEGAEKISEPALTIGLNPLAVPFFIVGRFDSRTARQRARDSKNFVSFLLNCVAFIFVGMFNIMLWMCKAVFWFFFWPLKLFKRH